MSTKATHQPSHHHEKSYLVTAALCYVNNVPHLGNAVCIIAADAYARFLRMSGHRVTFIGGTDEHGTTTEVKALEEGVTPRQLVDKYFAIHKELYAWFSCSFDAFGRTSSPQNADVTIDIFHKLEKHGFITENQVEQFFCEHCKRFLADRFVEGTCAKCSYAGARGDQCEHCGSLLTTAELLNPKCKICSSTPKVKESKHLFIDLPKMQEELTAWINSKEQHWSSNAVQMTKAWLREGLKERCITRDLEWGIRVPKKGFEGKVFYSWFDAPIGYIGITKEHKKDWHELWHSKDVELVQFMGKDNIPFHTILFPAFLIGTRDHYTLLSKLSVNEYLNYESGKFSKSRGEGVFCDDAKQCSIPADAFRYYILINRPENSDTVFSWQDFQSKINNELVANLGNLVNRTTVFLERFFSSEVPAGKPGKKEEELDAALQVLYENITQHLERIELKEALKEVMNVARKGNQYFQETEPWKTKDPTALWMLTNIVKDLALLIAPFLPETSNSITKQLHIALPTWHDLGKKSIHGSHKIGKPEHLFQKLEDGTVKELRERFKGKGNEASTAQEPAVLQLRVAKIIDVKEHANAEKLYVLQLDVGTEKRQIVSGLRGYYSADKLLGKHIVLLANLKPAKMRGVESQGMLLAADDGKDIVVLEAPKSNPGTPVLFDGVEAQPKQQITYDEFAKIEILVKEKHALWQGHALIADGKKIAVKMSDGAKVR
ncbi:methionine--tRNA ligase [Candidatus Woesearchaeota archaeon]|nr:methionine--tRNA ligase [Candidatus Woesearchaeota archaeon]